MARRSSGRKADYTWGATSGNIDALDLGVGADGLGSTALGFGVTGTLVRIRGLIIAELDPAAATAESGLVAVGIIKVMVDAFNAGIGSLPNPADDPGAEWVWFGHLFVSTASQFGGAEEGANQVTRLVIDSKAMRRFKSNETMVLMASVVNSADQGGTVDLRYSYRALFQD